MRKKTPRDKETLGRISERAAKRPPLEDEKAAEKQHLSDPLSSPRPKNGLPRSGLDQVGLLAIGDEHDGWTIDRSSRRSSKPTVLGISRNAPKNGNSFRISDTKTQTGLPPISRPTSIPVDKNHEGGAIDLVDRSQSSLIALDLKEEMEELYSLGEFTGSLRIAELILGSRPDDQQAQVCADNSRLKLEQQYCSKIGPLSQIPTFDLSDAEIRWLGLDHRAGFVLSRIDGQSSVEELADICGMSRLELFKTLIELLNRGAIHFEHR